MNEMQKRLALLDLHSNMFTLSIFEMLAVNFYRNPDAPEILEWIKNSLMEFGGLIQRQMDSGYSDEKHQRYLEFIKWITEERPINEVIIGFSKN